MKFIFTSLLLLLIATVFCDIFDKLDERACNNQLEDYQDCFDASANLSTEGNFEALCTKKCKKYYDNPVKVAPKCFKDELSSGQQEKIENAKKYFNILCATDGGGNNCPNTEHLIKYKFEQTKEQGEDIIKRTCKSKLCTDSLLEIIKENKKSNETENAIAYLNSKECRDQNSARALNIGSSLILTFTLFFILLF